MNPSFSNRPWRWFWLLGVWMGCAVAGWATPSNKAALEKHYDRFLSRPLSRCTTCHLPSENKFPESLGDFPHNLFGNRLRLLGEEWTRAGRTKDLSARLKAVAAEDSDGDGVANELEMLAGKNPGDPKELPAKTELAAAVERQSEFVAFLRSDRWLPFESVQRPAVPSSGSAARFPNPIDAFLEVERASRHLVPRPEAPRDILLRRVYQDLIGLNPTPEEQRAFLTDASPEAYERVVDRLLADPRHGERWGRHWMDVWRYSDWAGWTDGGQVRDSKPHIWRWRDWIVDSLNADVPYDRMILEMLAGDELAPEDPQVVRATGFLVRNYKMLSREQWLEDTIKHTSQAFMGVTVGCAKCHDHMMDPISQREYYAMRAVFEPHQVRTERMAGELDTMKAGWVRTYDSGTVPTYVFHRGDERQPLTNQVVLPGVPALFGGSLEVKEVAMPWLVSNPDQRETVLQDRVAEAERAVKAAQGAVVTARNATNATPAKILESELAHDLAAKKLSALVAVLAAEAPWREAQGRSNVAQVSATPSATNAVLWQRMVAVAEAQIKRHQARVSLESAPTNKVAEATKKWTEADTQYQAAVDILARPLDFKFTPHAAEVLPTTSTGRRLAFARWIANPGNPLTARVAVNHVWLRHFGRGLVPTPSDFGRNGRPATHPKLMDWLASEFMSPTLGPKDARKPWSFRQLHRLIVTSQAYRMASTPDAQALAADPDNVYVWRMSSRRMEAEAVRDNLLAVTGSLDLTRGGPDIDHRQTLTSKRRSIYLQHAAEKQSEFLQIFDGPSVTECYQRRPSVMPQQALALGNSEMALRQAKVLASQLIQRCGDDPARLVSQAYELVLARRPTREEVAECEKFLERATPVGTEAARKSMERSVENLALVLINHNDFVTLR